MTQLKLQKRLAAAVLKCGKGRVWLDPNEMNEIGSANSRAHIRKLVKDGLIFRKPMLPRSRSRVKARKERQRKGRHSGIGYRIGSRNARTPFKKLWTNRQQILRRLLRKYRATEKIDKRMYRELYVKSKGNQFRSKRILMEHIWKMKAQKQKEKLLREQILAKKRRTQRNKIRREAKEQRRIARLKAKADAAAKSALSRKQG